MSQQRSFVPDEIFPGLLRRLEERACLPGQLLEQLGRRFIKGKIEADHIGSSGSLPYILA